MARMKTFRLPEQEGEIPSEPQRKTKPVRVDRNTIIMVPEDEDDEAIEARVNKYKNRNNNVPGYIPWD